MARVMCVGIATLDIVNRVERYPAEDSEMRALAQTQQMGGNAANTAVVLAQLDVQTFWVGNLVESTPIVDQSFGRHGVDASLAVRIPGGVMPTSYILLSEANGSRSIVHYRDLPEYPADAFVRLDLRPYDWVHFEGRAIDQLAGMLAHARRHGGLFVSLEVEKPRPGIEDLFDQADPDAGSRPGGESSPSEHPPGAHPTGDLVAQPVEAHRPIVPRLRPLRRAGVRPEPSAAARSTVACRAVTTLGP